MSRAFAAICASLSALNIANLACASGTSAPGDASESLDTVVVTARLREEDPQTVPVALSVLSGRDLDSTFTLNIQQATQQVPSLNYSSPNPRNTAFTIRGLGSSVVAIAQANDGLEPGVGFYVDQVYHARPATAAFDFLDLERVEVLRGSQGTLFGKNTTAGAISLSTAAPSFTAGVKTELTGGSLGFWQGKAAVTGPLTQTLAGRLSASAAIRDGTLSNITTGRRDNTVDNAAVRGQLLWQPVDALQLRLIGDYSSIDTRCCTQVPVLVGTTLKPAARQFPAMSAALGYALPSSSPYERTTDIDAALKVSSHEGGVAALVDWQLSAVTVTSVSAWRWWAWAAANDRDYTSLSIQTIQGIPSRQDQYSQELRMASRSTGPLDFVAGLYAFSQVITGKPVTAYGPQATYWLLGAAPTYPGNLLDGYRSDGDTRFKSNSYAVFGEAVWHATDRLSLTTGLRYTQEDKQGSYATTVSGGLATTVTSLVNAKLSILRPQSYEASVNDGSTTGRVTAAWQWTAEAMSWLTWSRGAKSGGINMSGLPLNAANLPALATAVVRPEQTRTYEIGSKLRWLDQRVQFNIDAYQTDVTDFQANVVDTGPGALRGYLANIDAVRVRGVEADLSARPVPTLMLHLSTAWTDGSYVSYPNGPCPLEKIVSSTTVCDLSGLPLSTLPRWSVSTGAQYSQALVVAGHEGELQWRGDLAVRSGVYGDPSDSQYTRIAGYGVLNASLGWRTGHWEVMVWSKNLTDKGYLQNVTVQAGNSGLVLGSPGDPRTWGVSVRSNY